jgi:hypothetical protein
LRWRKAKESGIIRWDSQGINKIQRCLNDPPFPSQAERPPSFHLGRKPLMGLESGTQGLAGWPSKHVLTNLKREGEGLKIFRVTPSDGARARHWMAFPKRNE